MKKPPRRVRRTPEEAQRLILDAAETLIAKTGPQGLRLHDIAAAAGISHPLILHHFSSRAGLVRALNRQTAAELRDRLVATMAARDNSLEQQLDQVFDAFRGGLAQRLAWLATEDPTGGDTDNAMILRDIVDAVHAQLAAANPSVARSDTEAVIHLVAVAAFGEAMYGAQLRKHAGIAAGVDASRRFRQWLAALIREHRGIR